MSLTDAIKKIALFSLFASLIILSSCIENDIPYPTIRLQILQFEVEGELGNTVIDSENRVVTVHLSETVDPRKVQVKSLILTEGAQTSLTSSSVIDLSTPYSVELSLYQTYEWKIVAVQNITRSFAIENQIGASVIDVASYRAIAYVGTNTDLRTIRVNDLKLGAEGASYSRTKEELSGSFITSKTVNVTYHNRIESWTLFVFQTEVEVTTEAADAWTQIAWLKGTGKEDTEKAFEYRSLGSVVWQRVASPITQLGGVFTAKLTKLQPSTTYEYRAKSGEEYGEIVSFTTEVATPITDGGFDYWHQVGRVWNPWREGSSSFWDSGNKGATTIGESITVPTNDVCELNPSGQAASLQSKFVGIGSLGKFAAGNLFVGEYVRTDGTNGVLAFGRPYHSFPTQATIYYKYTPAPINYIDEELKDIVMLNAPDTCHIYMALGDWDEPVEIRTRKSERKLFDPNDPHIIAYATFQSGEVTSAYQKLTLDLEYRATNRTPTYLIMVCSASKYGDYFTGGGGSSLTVDELSVTFD
ncbi:MAG: PCMD domain-containing protein [Phocaeicola sp.]